ncbi:hypothetical protein B0T10DRAFT_511531 [Thelonectria olida]|uniref:Uncharacterized protein n=1 Tax=Thelonectria olida TaxID=1576542 RepID=A0A9P8W736_9HYPO|nr:hypothetical protein B0T10DRAFT_511531 [Thelonectria olida]
MLRNATWELRWAYQVPRHVGAVTCRKSGQSLSPNASRHAPRAVSTTTPSPSRHHHTGPHSYTSTTDKHPLDQLRSLRRALATDKEHEENVLDASSWKKTATPRGGIDRRKIEQDTSAWAKRQPLRKKKEQKLRLKKTWKDLSPNVLLGAFLSKDGPNLELQRNAATIRSYRLPVVLMQMHLRQEAEADPQRNKDILELLPSEREWRKVMDIVEGNGHTKADLDNYLYILLGANDEDRSRRFFEKDTRRPIFILNFLLRRGASIWNVSTLDKLLKYFRSQACNTADVNGDNGTSNEAVLPRSRLAMQNMVGDNFDRLMSRFADHCRRVEPRLMTTLADIVAQRLEWLQQTQNPPQKVYYDQCKLFNSALETFAQRAHLDVRHKQAPNAYFWEAQRILLGISDQLPKPLLVDKSGFKAIRAVLAGLPKNQAEAHSAGRYSRAWPPYLRPGDGMDEVMEPEESWTRTVRAGVMMQEAGFSKDQNDEAIDILQGLGEDGTPTIQQRTLVDLKKSLRPWAASIKATRNAREAWGRFQHPPKDGQQPGLDEYAVMFEKLFARDADAALGRLPGDNSLNYPTQEEPNLTEFEQARLRPLGVDELYDKMKLNGIAPSGYCLRVLVFNSESLEKASRYLVESTMRWEQSSNLLADDPDPESLKEIPADILSAYIAVCAKQRGQGPKHMLRAMRLVEARLGREQHAWASYLWMPILKGLGRSHRHFGMSLGEQLRLAGQLFEHIQECHGPSSWLLQRLANTLKRILRREVMTLSNDLKLDRSAGTNSLRRLYDPDARQMHEDQPEANPPTLSEEEDGLPLSMVRKVVTCLKELFDLLVAEEKQRRRLLGPSEASYLDAMLLRRDPVSAPVAHDYMVCLAFAGEFEEAAGVVKWLIREWSQDQLVEELDGLDEVPCEADMWETLCAFRAFAEPMVEEATVDSILNTLNTSRVGWTWPDDGQVEGYLESQHMANKDLRAVLDRVCQQRR